MKARKLILRLATGVAPLIAALAMSAPSIATQAAAPPIVVATSYSPSNCGKYTTADYTDLSLAASGLTGGTILVCPGTYAPMSGQLSISNASKVTIKAALTGPGNRPIIRVKTNVPYGLYAYNTTNLTVDGIIFDASLNTYAGFTGIEYTWTSGAIKNATVIGTSLTSFGVHINQSGAAKVLPVSITNSQVIGYYSWGIFATGKVKLTLTNSLLNGKDNGRVISAQEAVLIQGGTSDVPGPTGTISKNTIIDDHTGVIISQASKFNITNNVMHNVYKGVSVEVDAAPDHGADNIKITGNTITGIHDIGVHVHNQNAANFSTKKIVISGNTLVADQYTITGSDPTGVRFEANVSAPTNVTGTVSKNRFIGFPTSPSLLFYVNVSGFAGVNVGTNDLTP